MRILYITAVSGTMDFFVNTIKSLQESGNEIELACSTRNYPLNPQVIQLGCKHHEIDCSRTLSFGSVKKTIQQIREIVENGGFDIVHCHTPIAAFCTRLACRRFRKKGLKVVYTAHGFHFFKGAPLKNWLIYGTAEKLGSFWTDTLVTINTEDYAFAQKHLNAKYTTYIPGVGIDTKYLKSIKVEVKSKRKELGIPDEGIMVLSVGDLNENKNHRLVINALSEMKRSDIYYCIAGVGGLKDELETFAQEKKVNLVLLGFRNDVPELQLASDMYIHPSIREGLSVSIMEAMALGKAIACGRIRGNVDLIDDEGGALFSPFSVEECRNAIQSMIDNKDLREQMGKHNAEKIEFFSQEKTIAEVNDIYHN